MFETAELGRTVNKAEYREREPVLREQLLAVQAELRDADFPVVVLFAGVDGAGKGETANLLNAWMDPRGIVTRAYDAPSQEEAERPEFWRFWRDLPRKGRIGIFLSAWYHDPLLDHVYKTIDDELFDDRLDEIVSFERTLAADGALILKYWMHLGKQAQRKRLKSLEKDELQQWRVTKRDWDHWKLYDRFMPTAERLILRTSSGDAPWTIIEGVDQRYRSLTVGTHLLEGIRRRLAERAARVAVPAATGAAQGSGPEGTTTTLTHPVSVLSRLDLTRSRTKQSYQRQLRALQSRLNRLHRAAREKSVSTIIVFEGWDAAGKGGAIRRITSALDARAWQVISIAAPSDEERAQHYLWRFWRHLPRAGRVTIFDRSWYGRVLVERVEGFAGEQEWRRAYAEINEFEQHLINRGTVLLKYWIHIDKQEQHARFEARETIPHKRWKLTEEDWRNRERWDDYEASVNLMIEKTSTHTAPWHLIEGNDKRFARIKVLRTLCDTLEATIEPKTG